MVNRRPKGWIDRLFFIDYNLRNAILEKKGGKKLWDQLAFFYKNRK